MRLIVNINETDNLDVDGGGGGGGGGNDSFALIFKDLASVLQIVKGVKLEADFVLHIA